MESGTRKTHPLVLIAAFCVIALCLVGIGVLTGVIPTSRAPSPSPVSPAVAETPQAVEAGKPPSEPMPTSTAVGSGTSPAPLGAPAAAPLKKPVRTCRECGVVTSIRAVEVKTPASGLGAVAGGVAGAIIGYQFGAGKGKTVATAAGVGGGALAGHQVEKQVRKSRYYVVTVKMENGTRQKVRVDKEPDYRIGDKVKVVEGSIIPRG
jgi:outer membrane lipoprotein SlyB